MVAVGRVNRGNACQLLSLLGHTYHKEPVFVGGQPRLPQKQLKELIPAAFRDLKQRPVRTAAKLVDGRMP